MSAIDKQLSLQTAFLCNSLHTMNLNCPVPDSAHSSFSESSLANFVLIVLQQQHSSAQIDTTAIYYRQRECFVFVSSKI
jgi:hypothetical protein